MRTISFSGNVKQELAGELPRARHCRVAELAAIVRMCGIAVSDGKFLSGVKIHSENIYVVEKFFTLFEKTFNIKADISVRRNLSGKALYSAEVWEPKEVRTLLMAAALTQKEDYGCQEAKDAALNLLQKTCCRRSFLRGAFLSAGFMSDPNKAYHFEIVCPDEALARLIQRLIRGFSMDPKIMGRKKAYVVYLKEGSQIVDMLNVMGACISLMKLENVRILKEMRNSVNRKVNCETANIQKTVLAAVCQTRDILYLKENLGFARLSDELQETADARLANPDATLKELGQILSPPIGKSGVNHRLRKLSRIAEKIREGKEKKNDQNAGRGPL